MNDLRKAAEIVLEALDTLLAENNVANREYAAKANQALRQALAQSDDFVYNEDKSFRLSPSTGSFGIGDTPPKSEWVGLNEKETADLYDGMFSKSQTVLEVIRCVEIKLKEKNTTPNPSH